MTKWICPEQLQYAGGDPLSDFVEKLCSSSGFRVFAKNFEIVLALFPRRWIMMVLVVIDEACGEM